MTDSRSTDLPDAAGNREDPLAFGGPTASSWREQALTRVAELDYLGRAAVKDGESLDRAVLLLGMHRHLTTARKAAHGKERPWWRRVTPLLGGSPLERTASNLHAAETDFLRLAPSSFLCGQLPSLLANVRAYLDYEDPRRQSMEEICRREGGQKLSQTEKDTVIAASRAASSAARRQVVKVRSFRNILYATAVVLAGVAAGLVLLAARRPELLPLCFHPQDAIVCPTTVEGGVSETSPDDVVDVAIRNAAGSWDVPLVAAIGLVAAAMSAAVSLRKIQGTTLPYSLPVALAVLKLPTGALTAVMGLVLMRGEFVPGLSALDSPAQILAWAVLFGYAQQLFTRFIDDKAHRLLDQVSSQDKPRAAVPTATVVSRSDESPPANGSRIILPHKTAAS